MGNPLGDVKVKLKEKEGELKGKMKEWGEK